MLKKIFTTGLALFAVTGCTSSYHMNVSRTHNDVASSIDYESRTVIQSNVFATVEVELLEKELSPWISPKARIKITNNSTAMLDLKASDIKIGFNNFWFDVINYKVTSEIRDVPFVNDTNFKMMHEVLPNRSLEFIVEFETPKSEEYYQEPIVLFDLFTNLGTFDVYYHIRKKR